MQGATDGSIDMSDLYDYLQTDPEHDYEHIIVEELEKVFGTMGKFIAQKQIKESSGSDKLTIDEVPKVIDRIGTALNSMLGPGPTKDLKKTLKRRCGLPV